MQHPKVILLMGATATGKTDLALEIGRRFPVEVISVDSALIYRGMDIGTAKPSRAVLDAVPHHLVDIIDPAEAFSVWDFVQQSRRLAQEICERGRIPLLAGGTMMYCHAFEHGLNRLPQASESLRRRLQQEAEQAGWRAMHDRLGKVDPSSANRIRPTDTQRIQRALEVHELSGQPLSRLQQLEAVGFEGGIEKVILAVSDRARLHQRIEARFLDMLEQGFEEEVIKLKARRDLDLSYPSMRCVGYRQMWQYLDGELTRKQMIDKGIAATRQLAKRQITWLRKQPEEKAVDCLNYRKDAIFSQLRAAFPGL
jgi:tRNA dimethylallyltransferase